MKKWFTSALLCSLLASSAVAFASEGVLPKEPCVGVEQKAITEASDKALMVVDTKDSEQLTAAVLDKQLIVNGKTLDTKPIEINNTILVPARLVSDELGFKITWDAAKYEANIVGDSMESTVTVGEDLYQATSTVAIGATAPIQFGSSPVLVSNTLYVPANVFLILQGNDPDAVVVSQDNITINKIAKKENTVIVTKQDLENMTTKDADKYVAQSLAKADKQ